MRPKLRPPAVELQGIGSSKEPWRSVDQQYSPEAPPATRSPSSQAQLRRARRPSLWEQGYGPRRSAREQADDQDHESDRRHECPAALQDRAGYFVPAEPRQD